MSGEERYRNEITKGEAVNEQEKDGILELVADFASMMITIALIFLNVTSMAIITIVLMGIYTLVRAQKYKGKKYRKLKNAIALFCLTVNIGFIVYGNVCEGGRE